MTTVLPDGLVEFRFYRPRAAQVLLAGTFNGWRPDATPMRKDPAGWWRVVLDLTPGVYQFRYLADGQWFTDHAANGIEHTRLGCNSLLLVQARATRAAA